MIQLYMLMTFTNIKYISCIEAFEYVSRDNDYYK